MKKITSLTFISTAVLSGVLLTNSNIVKADTVSDSQTISTQTNETTTSSAANTDSNSASKTSNSSQTATSATATTNESDSKQATSVSYSASTDTTGAIVNNSAGSVAQSTYNGIVHATGFANADSDTLSTSSAILDVDNSNGKFNIVEKITNTTDEDAYVDFILTSPSVNDTNTTVKATIDSSKMSSFTSGLKNETIQVSYLSNPGSYQTVSLSDVDWSNVAYVRVSGIAEAGKTYTTVLPVEITNYDEVKSQLANMLSGKISGEEAGSSSLRTITSNDFFYLWKLNADGSKGAYIGSDSSNNVNIRVAKKATSVLEAIKNTNITNYARVLIRESDGTLNYQYSSEANEILKDTAIDSSYFEISNFGTYSSNLDALYTDGSYRINLAKIQSVLSKHGYSINVDSSNNSWPYYTYVLTSGNVIFTSDNSGSDSSSSGSGSGFYVEVQKVLTTQDLTLKVGDELNPTQISDTSPLMKAQIVKTNMTNTNETSTEDLTVDGKTLTVSAVDADGNAVDVDKITAKAGTYTLTYTYHLNNGTITNTSTITVVGEEGSSGEDKATNQEDTSKSVDSDSNELKPATDKEQTESGTTSTNQDDATHKNSDSQTSNDSSNSNAESVETTDSSSNAAETTVNNHLTTDKVETGTETKTQESNLKVQTANSTQAVNSQSKTSQTNNREETKSNENKLPQTGNHNFFLALMGLVLTTFAGVVLKKKH
ncbi:LPXTG cell wall anchor domain-containing protein [Lactobacillus psittaci]|uniref:Gram-positive cocci surface proteins LPxTG domain-containing protein n=1 Tax=Lactobacillus psittaci DSM 15354 TaxID=1122152 RepID=A0A0R1S2M3_9LACO|nr:LPXTG cell wall anchor domain-containing protein [Lactobacillus psittaci]KRL62798.1 hypothetical protein FC23_GL001269 [Lactobacillus psittaci DSM 15354]